MAKLHTESGLQAACHTWFHNSLPQYRGLGFMIHNDGAKHGIQAAQDKARGLVAGLPDWCLMVPCQASHFLPHGWLHGLFVEFKTATGRRSAIQQKRHDQLRGQGYRVELVQGLAHFQELITAYLARA